MAAIGNGLGHVRLQYRLRLFGDVRELRAIRVHILFLSNDRVMLGIDRDLHVVPDDARAAAACHRRRPSRSVSTIR